MRGKFVCLFSMFVALLFPSVLLHGQISLLLWNLKMRVGKI